MKEVRAYKCEYCGKVSLSISGIKNHERACKRNPANDTLCKDCDHCDKNKERIADGTMFEDLSYQKTTFTCKVDGTTMYSPRALRMKCASEIISQSQRMMATIVTGCPNYKFDI